MPAYTDKSSMTRPHDSTRHRPETDFPSIDKREIQDVFFNFIQRVFLIVLIFGLKFPDLPFASDRLQLEQQKLFTVYRSFRMLTLCELYAVPVSRIPSTCEICSTRELYLRYPTLESTGRLSQLIIVWRRMW